MYTIKITDIVDLLGFPSDRVTTMERYEYELRMMDHAAAIAMPFPVETSFNDLFMLIPVVPNEYAEDAISQNAVSQNQEFELGYLCYAVVSVDPETFEVYTKIVKVGWDVNVDPKLNNQTIENTERVIEEYSVIAVKDLVDIDNA